MGMLMGTAAELWEFANPESEVSKRLEASLRVLLAHGVRVTYIGSIDDQVVPLEVRDIGPAMTLLCALLANNSIFSLPYTHRRPTRFSTGQFLCKPSDVIYLLKPPAINIISL